MCLLPRVLNGIIMLGKAGDIIEDAEQRRANGDTSMADVSNLERSFNAKANNCNLTTDSSSITSTPIKIKREATDVGILTSNNLWTKEMDSKFKMESATSSPNKVFKSEPEETPFSTPNHTLSKRIKSKRVRLDSGAQVQEIEPYHHYYQLSDELADAEFQQSNSNSAPSSLLTLKLTPADSGSGASSPVSTFDDTSSIDLCPANLMTNSMVNLASVGLNQGPHTPDGEVGGSNMSSSVRSSCSSLSAAGEEVGNDEGTEELMETSTGSSNSEANRTAVESNLNQSHRSASAPDVSRLNRDEEGDGNTNR